MDFSKVEITKILKSAVANRFQDLSPQDFEDFIAQLFKDNDYEVEQTKYSGDFGADLIIQKGDRKIAVQVKRYSEDNKVGVQEINQVIGAKNYYNCSDSMVITTSSYSKQGENLAKETNTELWKWDDLLERISKIYWQGFDYYTFYKDEIKSTNKANFVIRIKDIETDKLFKGDEFGSIVNIEVENVSDKNITIDVMLPTFITKDFKQVEGDYKLSSSFTQGIVYSGCKIEIGYIFLNNKIRSLEVGDKLISKFIETHNGVNKETTYITNFGENQTSEILESFHDENIRTLKKNIFDLENNAVKLKEEIKTKDVIISKQNTQLLNRNRIILVLSIVLAMIITILVLISVVSD